VDVVSQASQSSGNDVPFESKGSASVTPDPQAPQVAQARLKQLIPSKDYKPTHRYTEQQLKSMEEIMKCEHPLPTDGWEKCDSVDGVEVHRKYIAGSAIPMMHSRCVMKGPPRAVYKVISDLKKKKEWDKMFKDGFLVEQLDDYTKVLYFEYNAIFPTSARDFVALSSIRPEEDGSIVMGGTSVEHEKCPPKDGNVRARAITSGWILRRQPGEEKRDYSYATNIALVDLSGNLPTRILQKIAANSPNMVKSVREIVDKMSPEDYELAPPTPSPSNNNNNNSNISTPVTPTRSRRTDSNTSEKFDDNQDPESQSEDFKSDGKIDRRKLDDAAVHKLLLRGEEGLRRVIEETSAKDWSPLGEEKGVRLYEKKGKDSSGKVSDFYCFMGKGVIKASPKLIFRILTKPQFRKEYDNMLKQMRIIRKLATNAAVVWAHMETRQCLVKQGRDFCILQYFRGPDTPIPPTLTDVDEFKGKYVVSSQSIIDPACPEQSDVIRGDVLCSGWVIEQVAKGESAVSVLLQVDFRGVVPPKLINIVGRKQPLCLYYLREYIEDRFYANLEQITAAQKYQQRVNK